MLAIMLAMGLALDQGTPRTSSVEDALLGDFYADEKTALCRDYLTANGARLATYQWWLMGFVSGARAAQGTKTPAVPRAGLNDVLEQTEKHCRAHPADSLGQAARALLKTRPTP